MVTTGGGQSRRYESAGPALLEAAGAMALRVNDDDPSLREQVLRDPLAVASALRESTGPIADSASASGLLAFDAPSTAYDELFAPLVGPAIAGSRLRPGAPTGALIETYQLPAGGIARRYDRADDPVDALYVDPAGTGLDRSDYQLLADAATRLADGAVPPDARGPRRAIQTAPGTPSTSADRLVAVLTKHTRGAGILTDLLAIPGLTDIFASAPVTDNPLRVRINGASLATNVRLTERGATSLTSTLRYRSGRALSQASPALDASLQTDAVDARVRVAAVTDPVSDGPGFAVRAHSQTAWTLPGLVASGTLPPGAGAFLSIAVERGASLLVAGARGAGKTTLLGALTWSLSPTTRLVVIEDTPELPVSRLQADGRDVQALHTDPAEGFTTSEALRTALRLGDGALALGEVRGTEATVLYEAMRVGATHNAVLGTIHGRDTTAVRGRVVDDLGVTPAAFGATDLVVTCAVRGDADHRLSSIAEIVGTEPGSHAALFEHGADGLEDTGRLARGNSVALTAFTRPDESYASLRDILADRESAIEALVAEGATAPADLTDPGAKRSADG